MLVILGDSGFIGTNLVSELQRLGSECIAFGRSLNSDNFLDLEIQESYETLVRTLNKNPGCKVIDLMGAGVNPSQQTDQKIYEINVYHATKFYDFLANKVAVPIKIFRAESANSKYVVNKKFESVYAHSKFLGSENIKGILEKTY